MRKSSRQLWRCLVLVMALVAGSAMAAELNTGYVVSNQGALGITRAFDDGPNTILAFVDLETQRPVLTDAAGKRIRYRQVDNYAVLPGRYTEVHVAVGSDTGIVRSAVMQPSPAPTQALRSTEPLVAKSSGSLRPGPQPTATAIGKGSSGTLASQPCTEAKATTPCASKQLVTPPPAKLPLTPLAPTVAKITPKPAPPPLPEVTWTIKQGYSIQQQLTVMGEKAHWNVVWNYPSDILAGADWTSHDDFPTTAEQIIKILAANGALIHYHTFTGNNTFLVYGTGASTP